VIVTLIVLNIIPRRKHTEEIAMRDKSIAVLPFINDSPDQERMYFINGIMESVLNNLCMIEDLRVPGRTSVEQYRNNPKPIPVVAEEMNVDYILEGSGHRDGNNVRLIVQLLDGRKDQHLWSKTYDADIEEIFSMQSEIAQLIAAEIEAIITPEEKQLIEKVPTTSLTALDFYQRGREEHYHYWSDNDNKEALENAEDFYYKALEYDSSFALAYVGLANVYQDKHYWETFLSEDFLDSVLFLADIALSYDNQLSEAYNKKGYYYSQKGRTDQAIAEYEKAIRFNPNDWLAYAMSANLYIMSDDLVKTISYRHKAVSLNHGPELSSLLRDLGYIYNNAGFIEKAKFYNQEALKLNNDSASYYFDLMSSERVLGNFEKAVDFGEKSYDLDSLRLLTLFRLGEVYLFLGKYEESIKYFKKDINRLKSLGIPNRQASGYIAYDYWACGYKDDAEYYFNEQINYCDRLIELEREFANKFWEYFTLAQVYAFKGEKDKAFENLNIFNQREKMCLWEGIVIKNSPLFDNIRDEPQFQQIVRDVEAKYQAEHERVRKWLEENDML
jgi:TolB-like protein